MTTTLNISHQRAVGDLLQAERDLRQKSEDAIRAMRQVLVETANRFDGKRLQEISRDNPAVPANWIALDWKSFFDEIPAPSQGWGKTVAPDTQVQRELRKEIAELKAALQQAELNLESEQAKKVVAVEPAPTKVLVSVAQVKTDAVAIENIPPDATPALTVIAEDARRMRAVFPQKIPAAFSGVLSGGERLGGDLTRVFQRYWLVLYMIGRWRLATAMELEEALANTQDLSANSGSMERVIQGMEKANVLVTEVINLNSPRTALKLIRFSDKGYKLYQALFQSKPFEDDWSRLMRLREGARFPEHTMAVLDFTMHARKRGWTTRVLPEVKGIKSAPDAWVMRGNEQFYVEIEMDDKEHLSKWRNQSALNAGQVALCASTRQARARLVEICKLEKLPGMATDLESLIGKFKDINSESPFWMEDWK